MRGSTAYPFPLESPSHENDDAELQELDAQTPALAATMGSTFTTRTTTSPPPSRPPPSAPRPLPPPNPLAGLLDGMCGSVMVGQVQTALAAATHLPLRAEALTGGGTLLVAMLDAALDVCEYLVAALQPLHGAIAGFMASLGPHGAPAMVPRVMRAVAASLNDTAVALLAGGDDVAALALVLLCELCVARGLGHSPSSSGGGGGGRRSEPEWPATATNGATAAPRTAVIAALLPHLAAARRERHGGAATGSRHSLESLAAMVALDPLAYTLNEAGATAAAASPAAHAAEQLEACHIAAAALNNGAVVFAQRGLDAEAAACLQAALQAGAAAAHFEAAAGGGDAATTPSVTPARPHGRAVSRFVAGGSALVEAELDSAGGAGSSHPVAPSVAPRPSIQDLRRHTLRNLSMLYSKLADGEAAADGFDATAAPAAAATAPLGGLDAPLRHLGGGGGPSSGYRAAPPSADRRPALSTRPTGGGRAVVYRGGGGDPPAAPLSVPPPDRDLGSASHQPRTPSYYYTSAAPPPGTRVATHRPGRRM